MAAPVTCNLRPRASHKLLAPCPVASVRAARSQLHSALLCTLWSLHPAPCTPYEHRNSTLPLTLILALTLTTNPDPEPYQEEAQAIKMFEVLLDNAASEGDTSSL